MNHIHNLTIKKIRELLENTPMNSTLEYALASDERQGVQQLLQQYQRNRDRQLKLEQQWKQMTFHEEALRKRGYAFIAGMDEVGRGPLAGPVVAAAVVLPQDFYLPGLNDSKKVPPILRESFFEFITKEAAAYTVSFADAQEIDDLNIYQTTLKVMRECVSKLAPKPEICLIDGRQVPGLETEQLALVGGDGLSVSIAAASIVAKVTRDRWMKRAASSYPAYGFEKNAGYGTPEHLAAIAKYGPCPLHRKTFAGVKEWI